MSRSRSLRQSGERRELPQHHPVWSAAQCHPRGDLRRPSPRQRPGSATTAERLAPCARCLAARQCPTFNLKARHFHSEITHAPSLAAPPGCSPHRLESSLTLPGPPHAPPQGGPLHVRASPSAICNQERNLFLSVALACNPSPLAGTVASPLTPARCPPRRPMLFPEARMLLAVLSFGSLWPRSPFRPTETGWNLPA